MAFHLATFGNEVRREIVRVTWITRKETAINTAMVFALASFAALFFLLVDQALGFGVRALFGIGG